MKMKETQDKSGQRSVIICFQKGFTLVELLVVITIVVILSAIVVSRGIFSSSESHGGEQLITELATRLNERQSEAQRLNGNKAVTAFHSSVAAPIEFDLTNLATTASLVTEGVDENADGIDDVTGDPLTFLNSGAWSLVYRGDQMRLPTDWKLAGSAAELGSIPLIATGAKGRGIPVTRIGFDGDGKALYRNAAGVWERTPSGTAPGKRINESAFWAFYFIRPGSDKTAIAVAVYPASGICERFRFDGTSWRGFADRIPSR